MLFFLLLLLDGKRAEMGLENRGTYQTVISVHAYLRRRTSEGDVKVSPTFPRPAGTQEVLCYQHIRGQGWRKADDGQHFPAGKHICGH